MGGECNEKGREEVMMVVGAPKIFNDCEVYEVSFDAAKRRSVKHLPTLLVRRKNGGWLFGCNRNPTFYPTASGTSGPFEKAFASIFTLKQDEL